MRKFFNDESGAIISAELALVLTILVIGVVVGLSEVAVAVNTELNDVSNAIGRLDQSYGFTGFTNSKSGGTKGTSFSNGSTVRDAIDDNDNNDTCDIVCGLGNVPNTEGGR